MKENISGHNQPIYNLQTMLHCISHCSGSCPDVFPDGIYGEETQTAVSSFQQNHNLPITGTVNWETWEAIASEYEDAHIEESPPEMVEVMLNNHVCCAQMVQSMLQEIAKVHKCIPLPVLSGCMDEDTAGCLGEFQRRCGLPADGKINKKTWKSLALHFAAANHLEDL